MKKLLFFVGLISSMFGYGSDFKPESHSFGKKTAIHIPWPNSQNNKAYQDFLKECHTARCRILQERNNHRIEESFHTNVTEKGMIEHTYYIKGRKSTTLFAAFPAYALIPVKPSNIDDLSQQQKRPRS